MAMSDSIKRRKRIREIKGAIGAVTTLIFAVFGFFAINYAEYQALSPLPAWGRLLIIVGCWAIVTLVAYKGITSSWNHRAKE